MAEKKQEAQLNVEFRATLPHQLISFLALLSEAQQYEGFDQQVYVTHAELSDELRSDIELIFVPLGNRLITTRLCSESPSLDDFAAFIGWLAQSSNEIVSQAVDSLLEDLGCVDCEERIAASRIVPETKDSEALAAFLRSVSDPWAKRIRSDENAFEQMLRLLTNPIELKARLVFILTQFWNIHGQHIYGDCASIIDRSLRYHTQRRYSGSATDIYFEVTGKRPSTEESQGKFDQADRLVFIPSCYSGAYATFSCPLGDESTLLVVFNCRSSGGHREGRPEIIRDLFPPLKALADETRLQILLLLQEGELYAQQIVDQLDLGQSSISRHLSLLVAGRILSVRKENGMKFYRVNQPAMERVVELLDSVSGKGGSD
ncbi:ArsR/SmtB family transcription factor [Candidatus Bipolaricaulota bacterium]